MCGGRTQERLACADHLLKIDKVSSEDHTVQMTNGVWFTPDCLLKYSAAFREPESAAYTAGPARGRGREHAFYIYYVWCMYVSSLHTYTYDDHVRDLHEKRYEKLSVVCVDLLGLLTYS